MPTTWAPSNRVLRRRTSGSDCRDEVPVAGATPCEPRTVGSRRRIAAWLQDAAILAGATLIAPLIVAQILIATVPLLILCVAGTILRVATPMATVNRGRSIAADLMNFLPAIVNRSR
jgi:hypothetical protein